MRPSDRHRIDPAGQMVRDARFRAKKRGLPFTITRDDVVVPRWCPALGIPLAVCEGRMGPGSPTLDRIDNRRGYEPGNVIVLSWRANSIKSNCTPEELERVAAFVRQLTPI